MKPSFFKGKKITVMGLGLHGGGVGVVKFLAKNGARVIVTDLKTKEQLAPSIEKLKGVKNITYVLGQHRSEDFSSVDMVVKTPPVPWTDKHIQLALKSKVPVEMDSSLFFKMCTNPIIGVTGTKGKTTTATLLAQLLNLAKVDAVKVGIGQVSVLDKLDVLKKGSIVVFELSSWRLSALGRAEISPRIAVLKNIMRDHLNYYKTMDAYIADKRFIFENQKPGDFLVANWDDPLVREAASKAPSQLLKFSYAPLSDARAVFIDGENMYASDGLDTQKIAALQDISIPGRHNLSNVMAAVGAALAYGINTKVIAKALPQLSGVPHRLEFVRDLGGVRYYNDTAATIPDAAISALEAFSEPLILIAGGTDKELEFAALAQKITEKTKAVVLLKGNATEKIISELKKAGFATEGLMVALSMEEAVFRATELAARGDVVLLSPGAASFGLFANEFERGEKFRSAVKMLK